VGLFVYLGPFFRLSDRPVRPVLPRSPGPVPLPQPVIAHVGTALSVRIDSPQIVTVLSVLTVEESAQLASFWGSLCAPAIVLEESGCRAIDCMLAPKRVVSGDRL
jgi:hypothetical protein